MKPQEQITVGGMKSVGLIAIGGVNSMGIVAIGGVNSIGVIAIGGASAIGVVAIGGANALGLVALGAHLREVWSLARCGTGLSAAFLHDDDFRAAFVTVAVCYNIRDMPSASNTRDLNNLLEPAR